MWFAAAALAGTVPAEELGRWANELVPEVAAAAGREFRTLPVLRLHSLEEARALRAEELRILLADQPPEVLDEALRENAGKWGSALAVTVGHTIIVLTDTYQRAAADQRLPDEVLDAALRCTLAHELAHVLENEAGLRPLPDAESVRAARATGEGVAEWVAEQVCRARGERAGVGWMFASKGTEALTERTLPTDLVVRYGWGRVLAASRVAAGGTDALWALFTDPPDRVVDLVAEAQRARVPRLDDAVVTAPLADVLPGFTLEPDPKATSNLWWGMGLAGLEAAAEVADVRAFVATAPEQGGGALVVALRFSDPMVVPPFLLERRAMARIERRAHRERVTVRGFPALEGLAPHDGALVVTWPPPVQASPSRETWVASGDLLVIVRAEDGALGVPASAELVAGVLEAGRAWPATTGCRAERAGRVEVAWKVRDGAVVDPVVVEDTTGDEALATCLLDGVRRWRFSPDLRGRLSWSFVFPP